MHSQKTKTIPGIDVGENPEDAILHQYTEAEFLARFKLTKAGYIASRPLIRLEAKAIERNRQE